MMSRIEAARYYSYKTGECLVEQVPNTEAVDSSDAGGITYSGCNPLFQSCMRKIPALWRVGDTSKDDDLIFFPIMFQAASVVTWYILDDEMLGKGRRIGGALDLIKDGRFLEASGLLLERIDYLRRTGGDHVTLAISLVVRAAALGEIGRLEEALGLLSEVEKLAPTLGNFPARWRFEAGSMVIKGLALAEFGRYNDAIAILGDATDILSSNGFYEAEVICRLDVSRLNLDNGDYERAIHEIDRVLEISRGAENLQGEAYALFFKAEALAGLGRHVEAYYLAMDASLKFHILAELVDGGDEGEEDLRLEFTMRRLEAMEMAQNNPEKKKDVSAKLLGLYTEAEEELRLASGNLGRIGSLAKRQELIEKVEAAKSLLLKPLKIEPVGVKGGGVLDIKVDLSEGATKRGIDREIISMARDAVSGVGREAFERLIRRIAGGNPLKREEVMRQLAEGRGYLVEELRRQRVDIDVLSEYARTASRGERGENIDRTKRKIGRGHFGK